MLTKRGIYFHHTSNIKKSFYLHFRVKFVFFKRQNSNNFIFLRVFNRGRDIICKENGCSLDSGCCEPPLRRTILENNE